jgi:hypothetical protein
MNAIINRLKEPSTYRGLSILMGLIGVYLSPEQTNAISAAVAAAIGLIEVFRKETPSK